MCSRAHNRDKHKIKTISGSRLTTFVLSVLIAQKTFTLLRLAHNSYPRRLGVRYICRQKGFRVHERSSSSVVDQAT